MTPERDRLLCKCFPNLYRNRDAQQLSAMSFGFGVNNGWFDIIVGLSEKLEELIVAEGAQEYPTCAAQVKEKFGVLRFYMDCSTDEMEDLISQAERASATTCEVCGNDGELRTGGWAKTLCDICFLKRDSYERIE